MKDFFISYTSADERKATQIAYFIEQMGYSVTIQAWDFRVGDNLIAKIHESVMECEKIILVLSEKYLVSPWCGAEWEAFMREQIETGKHIIIPMRVEPVKPQGLLGTIIYVDLFDKQEKEIKTVIKNAVQKENMSRKPSFEGKSILGFNIEHISIENHYYVDEDKIVFIKKCKSRVLESGYNKIHNRISWFADESVTIMSETDGVTIEQIEMNDTNINFNVVFGKRLAPKRVIEYAIKIVVTNRHKHFKNFFSTEIITPMNALDVYLSIWNKNIKKVYVQKLSSSLVNSRTEEAQEKDIDLVYHWHVQNPELHFEYKIYW